MLLHLRELHQAKPELCAELGNVPAPGSMPSTNSQLPAARALSAVRACPGRESLMDPSRVLGPPGWLEGGLRQKTSQTQRGTDQQASYSSPVAAGHKPNSCQTLSASMSPESATGDGHH